MLEEERISQRNIFKGKFINLREDTIKLPSGKKAAREIVEHPGAVAVIAINEEKEMIFVRQFRTAAGKIMLEIPAGAIKPGESGENCSRRELEEETGYFAKKIRKIWEGYASPGYSTEVICYYLAQDLVCLKQKTEEDEFIEVDLVNIEDCVDLLKNGKINDNKTIIGITIAEMALRGEI